MRNARAPISHLSTLVSQLLGYDQVFKACTPVKRVERTHSRLRRLAVKRALGFIYVIWMDHSHMKELNTNRFLGRITNRRDFLTQSGRTLTGLVGARAMA